MIKVSIIYEKNHFQVFNVFSQPKNSRHDSHLNLSNSNELETVNNSNWKFFIFIEKDKTDLEEYQN